MAGLCIAIARTTGGQLLRNLREPIENLQGRGSSRGPRNRRRDRLGGGYGPRVSRTPVRETGWDLRLGLCPVADPTCVSLLALLPLGTRGVEVKKRVVGKVLRVIRTILGRTIDDMGQVHEADCIRCALDHGT